MRGLVAIFMVLLFVVNVLFSVAGALMVCAHSDHIHIVDYVEHSRNDFSSSDNSAIHSSSECFDVFLGGEMPDILKSVSFKTPIPNFVESRECRFFKFASFESERDFFFPYTRYRPPDDNLANFNIPLLI